MATQALAARDRLPWGPVLLGMPQDLLEHRFIPPDTLTKPPTPSATSSPVDLTNAADRLAAACQPVFLVNDYLLLHGQAAEVALGSLADRLQAPVWQVAYRRGPMLFQRLRPDLVPTLHGYYDPADAEHRKAIDEADLLLTVEDRNMYPRIVGPLPGCPKIVITWNPDATRKNGYLTPSDPIITGRPAHTLARLAAVVLASTRRGPGLVPPPSRVSDHCLSRTTLLAALTGVLATTDDLVIVDDSQTFGGLLAQNYDLLPDRTRVLASHGGFVGSGLATAIGAAIASPRPQTVCILGDQGFTNGVKALAVAGEQRVPILIIVCNNHASVSLRTQADADFIPATSVRAFTGNNPSMSYTTVARGYGLRGTVIDWPSCHDGLTSIDQAAHRVATAVHHALHAQAPHVLELVTARNDADFSHDVWRTSGHEPVGKLPRGPDRTGWRNVSR
jgi:acetolactate synthase-1/2/3 large subunit